MAEKEMSSNDPLDPNAVPNLIAPLPLGSATTTTTTASANPNPNPLTATATANSSPTPTGTATATATATATSSNGTATATATATVTVANTNVSAVNLNLADLCPTCGALRRGSPPLLQKTSNREPRNNKKRSLDSSGRTSVSPDLQLGGLNYQIHDQSTKNPFFTSTKAFPSSTSESNIPAGPIPSSPPIPRFKLPASVVYEQRVIPQISTEGDDGQKTTAVVVDEQTVIPPISTISEDDQNTPVEVVDHQQTTVIPPISTEGDDDDQKTTVVVVNEPKVIPSMSTEDDDGQNTMARTSDDGDADALIFLMNTVM